MHSVNQKGVKSGGDTVAGDKITNNNYVAAQNRGAVQKLLDSLEQQIADNEKAKDLITELSRYHERQSIDGVVGLEAKLKEANRSEIYFDAIQKKELFAKMLEKYALFSSAQEIFSIILAKVENQFNYVIYPQLEERSIQEINADIIDKIVDPIVNECGGGVLSINQNHVFGMIYWLAEQCFIRWHK